MPEQISPRFIARRSESESQYDATSFLLASLTATWQATSRGRWHIRAKNLGDTRFEEVYGFRGPGRSIHLGVQFSFLEEADRK